MGFKMADYKNLCKAIVLLCFVALSTQFVSKAASNNQIVFLSSRDHICNSDGMCNETIYTMNMDGSHQRRLIDKSFWVASSWLSPDSSQVIFSSPWFGPQQLYLMSANGENLRQLTHDVDTVFSDVSWSANKQQLAFTSGSVEYGNTTLRRRDREVYVMDVDGSNKKALTNTGWNEFLFLSADTNSIIFISDRSGTDAVYIMDKDGSHQRLYLSSILTNYEIESWSPERKYLLPHLTQRDERAVIDGEWQRPNGVQRCTVWI
jgi:Tol biopolymer transport system component